ncbi:MAG: squalene--hopene cyclase [Planctomycetes bacterium]|nr:squalene--hopene cyclase [Planctomycetota bacterium]
MQPSRDAIDRAYRVARDALLAERHADGHWVGELSASALSTATAIGALSLVQKHTSSTNHVDLIAGGLAWLRQHQNTDGGWGDTVKSLSNISTTMLCRAAIHLAGAATTHADCLARAEGWLAEHHGRTPEELAEAVRKRYGKDRTFSVPILTMGALAGIVSWREVPYLPFELACFPQSWFRFLRLHVVSYALPALIAIGQAVHHHRPPWNPVTRLIRWLARRRSLRVLQEIQPTSGGYLEATPLTSFVTMSLASIGHAEHSVTRLAVEFLVRSARGDGSWAIDTNLATWVTTLAVNALATAGELQQLDKLPELQASLLRQQYKERHPYTGANPGGWAWTDLPGGVPDADDTPGALLALAQWCPVVTAQNVTDPAFRQMLHGLQWLLDLRNRDGGWPTFCRGWGRLPFDRSGSDLTAHALRAFRTWQERLLPLNTSPEFGKWDAMDDTAVDYWHGFAAMPLAWAVESGLTFLSRQQRPDGSWVPLWFGNQHHPEEENPTYGTARVLAAYRDLDMMNSEAARRGVQWLMTNQNPDGGWGGGLGTPSSVEETALAVEILVDAGPEAHEALRKGMAWLIEQVDAGGLGNATPIGFYFAKLWYFEKLYPLIFTVAALGRVRAKQSGT